jgi:magnesium chelatase family protein
MLVAAMNPCPCGYLGDAQRPCTCSALQVQRYRSRVSGPLLDRVDIQTEVPAVPYRELAGAGRGETSAVVRARVDRARRRQLARFAGRLLYCNAQMTPDDLARHCPAEPAARALLERAMRALVFSARAYTRILKVARTIADLADADSLGASHVAEAIQYRNLDRPL